MARPGKEEKEWVITMTDLEDFHPDDRQTMRNFHSWLKATGRCSGTWSAYKYALVKVSEHLPAPLVEASKEDMVQAVGELRDEDLKRSTVSMMLSKLKGFYKWLSQDGSYPEPVAWITTDSVSTVVLPDELLSRENIRAMIDACTNSRDRAIVAVIF
ncbi:hypothetical protein AKJ36_03485 [candidate division MSBL1 archaeon SCGC-AAA259I07]|uniref:Core-binding (CB) domain-containing protein n=1 Tax=candidate division MSBL1 archaeon SCGC-AAA259I07 TaxID=1698266 RepID=A0A133UJ42_9EURY|nr:hypothetical protein AKJ36_03485 [candidate division MSBL1 archaeon SCGC-AAA259I07]